MSLHPGSRSRLTDHLLERFSGPTLFDRVARTACRANCLPRKELYESWETARRVRRHFRGGRVIDLAAGHGLLAHLMLILDDSSPSAIAIDRLEPPSAVKISAAFCAEWPRLSSRVSFLTAPLEALPFTLGPDDLLVSAHACGALTDRVLELAIAARARVAVLPCCQSITHQTTAGLEGWVDGALAVDLARAARLMAAGFTIRTIQIPEEISPKNRLLLGSPRSGVG